MFGLSDRFVRILGDIKISPNPLFVQYCPSSYRLRGSELRDLIPLLQPGDLLLRYYDHYLDNLFIPGHFSHIGIYVGEIKDSDREIAGLRMGNSRVREGRLRERFTTGPQMVVHSISEGVFAEDLLDFSRCDELMVLRLPEELHLAYDSGNPFPESLFGPEEKEIRSRLLAGEIINRSEIVPLMIAEALKNVGRRYDFNLDFGDFSRLSCTELVYLCLKSVAHALDLAPRKCGFGPIQKMAITPDHYLEIGLSPIWKNKGCKWGSK